MVDTVIPAGATRVLIVDDEAGLRRSLARILGARGFTVSTAEDGEQAVDSLEKSEPDVILVDLMMPKMGGMQVLAHVKKTHPRIEVIVMTAHGDVDTAVAAVKNGAWDFLTKPFASNEAVALAVAKAAEYRRLVQRAQHLEERLEAEQRFGGLGGASMMPPPVVRPRPATLDADLDADGDGAFDAAAAPPDSASNGHGDAGGAPSGTDDADGPEPPLAPRELYALPYAEAKRRAMLAFDDRYLTEVLAQVGGNLSAAARHAGLDRSNFRRLMKKRKPPT